LFYNKILNEFPVRGIHEIEVCLPALSFLVLLASKPSSAIIYIVYTITSMLLKPFQNSLQNDFIIIINFPFKTLLAEGNKFYMLFNDAF
jgi:hypothetical protein